MSENNNTIAERKIGVPTNENAKDALKGLDEWIEMLALDNRGAYGLEVTITVESSTEKIELSSEKGPNPTIPNWIE